MKYKLEVIIQRMKIILNIYEDNKIVSSTVYKTKRENKDFISHGYSASDNHEYEVICCLWYVKNWCYYSYDTPTFAPLPPIFIKEFDYPIKIVPPSSHNLYSFKTGFNHTTYKVDNNVLYMGGYSDLVILNFGIEILKTKCCDLQSSFKKILKAI